MTPNDSATTGVEVLPLIGQQDDSKMQEEYLILHTKLMTRKTSWSHMFVLLAILLLGVSTGFALSHYISNKPYRLQYSTYSPANSALGFSQENVYSHETTIYSGPPTTEQTKAWERLLEPVMIQASYDEMALAGENPDSSIQLLEGEYLASLGVYHELHCLRRIRFFLYSDYFYPNMTVGQRDQEGRHIEHCLETLRVAAMCMGNTGLWTFEWKPNTTRAHPKTSAQRSCVEWNALDNWTRQRAVGFNPLLKPRPQGL